MSASTYTDSPYKAFTEETSGQLTGKEGYVVELASTGNVQLFTSGKAIGVMHAKLQGSNDVTIRLLGKGGTVKMVAGGAITVATRVKAASGGKVVASSTTGDRSLGLKISPTANGADLDVIEVLDVIEYVP